MLASGAVILVIADLASLVVLPAFAWAALLVPYVLLNAPRLRLSAGAVLTVAFGLALFCILTGTASPGPALGGAGFFFALLVILQILGRAATRSPDVVAGAEIIVSRPPGLRYLFLTFGAHLFGLFLNIGSVILMISMLSGRLKQESEETVRSLTLAVLRGFSGTPMWSPLSLSVLVLLSLIEGVSYWHLAPVGMLAATFYMLAGYRLDSGKRRVAGAKLLSPTEKRTLGRVLGRIACLIVGALALVVLFGLRLIDAVFLSALVVAAIWIGAQHLSPAGPRSSLWKDICEAASSMVNEASLICGSAFIGALLSTLIVGWGGFPGALSVAAAVAIAAVLPLAVVAGGLLAINPLITASVLAGTLDPAWPADGKFWLALPLVIGWGLTASGTPFNATILVTSRILGRNPIDIALRWNSRLTALSVVAAGLVAAAGLYLSQ